MGDMGLESAYGNASMADQIRQRIKDQIEAQQRAQALAQQQFTNNRLTANDARQAEEHAANMASLNDQRKASQAQMQEGDAAKIAPMLSINQSLPPMIAGRLRNTMQGANMADNPPLAQPPNMPDMMQPDIVPGEQPGAVWKGTDAQRSGEEQKQLRGRLINNPDLTDRERLMINMENAGLKVPANMEAKPTVRQPVQVGPQGIFTDPADAIGKPGYHAPQQPIVVQTGNGPQLLNRGQGTTTPIKEAGSGATVTGPATASEKQAAQTKKETLDTLAQLDQAIENAKDLIGPGQGRISNLEQLAGSGDPRIQALNVKMKATKMRVDHAITGSVRSGASPTLLQQWDNILANKVTPEGLKAGVQAMREILGGGAAAGGAGPNVGDTKTFPNGATAVYDGQGWVKQ